MPLYHVNYSFKSNSSNDTMGRVFETHELNAATVQVSKSVYTNTNIIQIIVPKLLHFHMQKQTSPNPKKSRI